MKWPPVHKVIVPVDFSEQSFAAVNVALDIVDDASKVHVIHVLKDLEVTEPGAIWGTIDRVSLAATAKENLRKDLDQDPQRKDVTMEVIFGDPGHEITESAKRNQAELIVMPSHGRTGLSRLMLGSVAERTIRLAPCPVLVLRRLKSESKP